MSSLLYVITCFALCCSFAAGEAKCIPLTEEVKDLCPFYNDTVEGHLPEINRNTIIHHFNALFVTECSPLLRVFVCSMLFPLCSLTGVVLPCRDVCFSVYTACHHVYLLHRQVWPTFFNCSKLPARPQVCLFPPPTTSHFSSLSPTSSPPRASSPSSTSLSPFPMSHFSSLLPSSSPSFASSPLSTSSSPFPTSHLSSLSPSSGPNKIASQPPATFYCFIILAPLLVFILGLVFKSFFRCQPSVDHTARFTTNSVSFSSPPHEPSSPPPHHEQPQSPSQSPDVAPPSPPPPLPPKKKNCTLTYENTRNTTLYAVAEIL